MKNNVIWALLLSPFFSTAQSQEIAFEHGLSWQEVLQRAKKENKYVFVDCYATGCSPCNWMEKEVYSVDSVGTFMNERFISVRVQMDTNRQDTNEIRQWYSAGHDLKTKYDIGTYPSYLFFDPDGQAVHKDMGGKNIKEFLSMTRAAMDSRQQYYTLLAEYRKNNLSYRLMPVLADAAQRAGQDSISKRVGLYYIHHYLETLPAEQLWTQENIFFVCSYSSYIGIADSIFQLYYFNRANIDAVMHEEHFSDRLINYVLYRDEVKPSIEKAVNVAAEPQWHQIKKRMAKKFDVLYVNKNILQSRVEYYKVKGRWGEYIKYFLQAREMDGIESWQAKIGNAYFLLNNDAFEVFKYDNNKRELKKALSWVNRALAASDRPDPQVMDTKANLLYKLGKKAEALTLEKKSHALSPKDKDITANYEKMKNNLPTWLSE